MSELFLSVLDGLDTASIGNSSVNAVINSTSITLGNTFITNSYISIGNSTVNTTINSTALIIDTAVINNISSFSIGSADALIVTANAVSSIISSNTNNWNPGITDKFLIRVSVNTDNNTTYEITGLDGGVNGQIVTILNTGVGELILKADDSNSNAENRFIFSTDITLYGDQAIKLYYDDLDSKWKPLNFLE